jgi:hypothetical protein
MSEEERILGRDLLHKDKAKMFPEPIYETRLNSHSTGCPENIAEFAVFLFSRLSLSLLIFFSLWLCSPAQAMASLSTRFVDQTQRRATVGRTPLDE